MSDHPFRRNPPHRRSRRRRRSHRPRQRCLVVQLPSPRTAPETLADRPQRQPTHLLRPNPLPPILSTARPHTRTTRRCRGAATPDTPTPTATRHRGRLVSLPRRRRTPHRLRPRRTAPPPPHCRLNPNPLKITTPDRWIQVQCCTIQAATMPLP